MRSTGTALILHFPSSGPSSEPPLLPEKQQRQELYSLPSVSSIIPVVLVFVVYLPFPRQRRHLPMPSHPLWHQPLPPQLLQLPPPPPPLPPLHLLLPNPTLGRLTPQHCRAPVLLVGHHSQDLLAVVQVCSRTAVLASLIGPSLSSSSLVHSLSSLRESSSGLSLAACGGIGLAQIQPVGRWARHRP